MEYAGTLLIRETRTGVELECAAVSDENVHWRVMRAAREVERLLWRIELDPEMTPKNSALAVDISSACIELASWVGWSDPRVQVRLAQLEEVWPGFPALVKPATDPEPADES